MTITIRLSEHENSLIKDFAALQGENVSSLIRRLVLERIEDELDLKTYYAAMADYEADPDKKTYSFEEVKRLAFEDDED